MEEQQTKRQPKGMIIGIIIAIIAVVGSASAFFLLKTTPKEGYFKAEKATIDQAIELFENRYENEFKWLDTQYNKPVESSVKLSADWNDSNVDADLREVQSIVNNSELTLGSVYDAKKKELEVGLTGKLGAVSVDPVVFNIDSDNMFLSLPFTEDVLQLNGKDFGKFMEAMDPYFDGPAELDFSKLFDQEQLATKKFQEYVMDEYGEFLYTELPDDAFESTKEELDLYGEKVKAEKIEMKLTEKQTKAIIKKVLEKTQKDEQFQKLFTDLIIEQSTGGLYTMPNDKEEAEMMVDEFNGVIKELIDEIDTNLQIPDGIQSTIWVHKKSVVKRSFAINAGDEVELQIVGEQLLEKEQQQWTYDFIAIEKSYGEETKFTFTGDLNWDGKKGADSMKIVLDDMELVYEGEESLEGKKRTFNRGIEFKDSYDTMKFIWDGTATHESDSATASHQFKLEGDLPYIEDISLNLDTEGKVVKAVEMPSAEGAVNVGTMSMEELEDYVYNELMPKLGPWAEEFMAEFYNY